MKELHLIILWNEYHLGEVEDTINKRFKVIRKISIPPLDKEFGKEKRLEILNVIYRFELPIEELMSVSKGTHPMTVFVVIDENPVYELKQTKRQLKHFNKNLFYLKRELRKGRSNYLHATDNIEETHDDLKIFSEVTGDSSIYDEWNKWRPTFNSLTDYFEELNSHEGLEYVVMRNFDNYPNEVQLDGHADIDILTNDYFLFKAISGGKARKNPMVEDGGYKVCNKVRLNNVEVDVDVRHIGDNYYCIEWERDILDNRVLHNGFYIMDDVNHFYSLMYHGLCQKAPGGLSDTYKKKFLDFEPKMNVGINESNVHNEEFLFSTLDKFMKEKSYDYIRPNELSISFRTMIPLTLNVTKSIKIKLGGKNESTYFNGDEYEFIVPWNTKKNETEEECNSERYDISTKDRYYFTGRFCRFLGSKDKDYGYKIFTDELERKQINILFDIQNLLFKNGFAPRPHEIIKCHDDTREYFAIKMDNIRGTHVQPEGRWIKGLIDFCEKNKIYREVRSIRDDCVPKNCIEDNGKIYLVDIDQRYRMDTEKKNVVLIPWIEREEAVNKSGIGRADRTKGYKYGVDSWKQWCEKHDVEFFLMDTLLVPESEMVITWQRWYVLEILEENGINYDQVLLVDADTIVHPDCPNFFEETNHEFSSQLCNGDYEWVSRAIKGYSQMFFGCDYYIMSSEFFQTCFVILNEKHRDFLKKVVDWYWENKDQVIPSYDIVKCGSDQPLINLLTKKFGVDVNFLPYKYSIMDLHRKNLIYTDPNWNWWQDDLNNLYNSGWVYQFNAIPQNRMERGQSYWMERIYNELYNV